MPFPLERSHCAAIRAQRRLDKGWAALAEYAEGREPDTGTLGFARKLDVDLKLVQATGPGGSVTEGTLNAQPRASPRQDPPALRGLRRTMAQRMRPTRRWFRRPLPMMQTSTFGSTSSCGWCARSRRPVKRNLRSMFGTMLIWLSAGLSSASILACGQYRRWSYRRGAAQ